MISLEKKFLFVHMPKTGGNSIQNVLRKYSEDAVTSFHPRQDGYERFDVQSEFSTTKHSKLYEYKELLPREIYSSLYKFAAIRNPWDRVVSRYFFKLSCNSFSQGMSLGDFAEPVFKRDEFIRSVLQTPLLENYLFGSSIEGDVDFLNDTDIDYIIKMEAMQVGFDEVCATLGIAKEMLPTVNKSNRRDYHLYYDEELIEIVRQRFANEIDYFHYEY